MERQLILSIHPKRKANTRSTGLQCLRSGVEHQMATPKESHMKRLGQGHTACRTIVIGT